MSCLEARVELNREAEEVVDDVRVVVKALVDHEAEDAHLGGAAVVELDAALRREGGVRKAVRKAVRLTRGATGGVESDRVGGRASRTGRTRFRKRPDPRCTRVRAHH